ncbi:hypothetical protein BC828DRAFT_388101 [Blastocladiella britannica]|nr:hypothetical protein BC828DRAFT_388101 [Blastocladiella britannica]
MMKDLPNELWIEIGRHLASTSRADLTLLAATSHRFFALVYSSPALWLSLWQTRRAPPDFAAASDLASPRTTTAITPGLTSQLWCLDLEWLATAPAHLPVLVQRLGAVRVRRAVRALWLPADMGESDLVADVLTHFPNLAAISSASATLATAVVSSVRHQHERDTTAHQQTPLEPPSSRPSGAAPQPPQYPLPNLQRVYLTDDPTITQYTLLTTTLPHLSPHPHPLSVTLCLHCHTRFHPYTRDHDEFGCPAAGCQACVPESLCIACGFAFCGRHRVLVSGFCARAAAAGDTGAGVCAWCAEKVGKCETCGAVDCPHCDSSPADAAIPVAAVAAADQENGEDDQLDDDNGDDDQEQEIQAPPPPPAPEAAPVHTCSKCGRKRCTRCSPHYTCVSCASVYCLDCVEGATCIMCPSDDLTCSACFVDVHLGGRHGDSFADAPKVCERCEFPFCGLCRGEHACDSFQIGRRLAASVDRGMERVRRTRDRVGRL